MVRGLPLARGDLKPASGATARFNSVDLSSVRLPPLTKSMSSLSPRASLTCPTPNEAWSIQSCGFQCLTWIGCEGAALTASMCTTTSECRTVLRNEVVGHGQDPNIGSASLLHFLLRPLVIYLSRGLADG